MKTKQALRKKKRHVLLSTKVVRNLRNVLNWALREKLERSSCDKPDYHDDSVVYTIEI